MPFKVRVMDDRFKVGTDVINWDDPFWSFVAPEMLSGCWLWTGSLSSGERTGRGTGGYGVICIDYKQIRTSRYALEQKLGRPLSRAG